MLLSMAFLSVITKIINNITRSLNIFGRKTNDVIIFLLIFIRHSLPRGHHHIDTDDDLWKIKGEYIVNEK